VLCITASLAANFVGQNENPPCSGFGRKLSAAGVSVRSVRYNGTIHDFMLLNPIASTPAVRAAVDRASDYLRKVFAER
jgi:acetyl esterase/lipase